MKCYIGIVLFAYNYMMISSQVLSDDEETSYIGIDNGTKITECVPVSSMNSYVKHRCPKNMELYPVEEGIDVWICDCKPRFLYFPLTDSCYELYRQGPCSSQNYLVLLKNETMSRCVKNRCLQDGKVPYNDACYPLQNVLCDPYLLELDVTTFQLKCQFPYTDTLNALHAYGSGYGFIDNFPSRYCPLGSRRSLKSEACIKVRHN